MKTITFKVSDSEARRLMEAVRDFKGTLSDYLRRVAVPPAAKPKYEIRKHPVSGAPYMHIENGKRITGEDVRKAMEDFP